MSKTVDRAIDMLECFTSEEPELTVTKLAEKLSVHKSIASRLAATLRAKNFLQLNPETRRYRVGRRIFELSQLFNQHAYLSEIAMPHLHALARSVGHASHLGVLDNQELLIVACVESTQQLQVALQAGERRPLHATASGKLFLAFGSEELLATLSSKGKLEQITPNTIVSLPDVKRELAAIRKAGIATSREERSRGIGAVAAPIHAPGGGVVASVATVFPISLISAREWTSIADEVRETARKISMDL